MNTHEIINFIGINSPTRYLEIGVHLGQTFNALNYKYKVGVDPDFLFDYLACQNENVKLYQMTSDEFWVSKYESEKFDLIFLDGLHTFEQTFRDFCASIQFAHDKTIWLVDDVIPTSFLAAHPNSQFVARCRQLLRSKDTSWMGDVYKVIFAIHDLFPQYSYATFPEHGQTVIWKEARQDFKPLFTKLKPISEMNYFDFQKNKDSCFNICSYEKIKEKLSTWLVTQ